MSDIQLKLHKTVLWHSTMAKMGKNKKKRALHVKHAAACQDAYDMLNAMTINVSQSIKLLQAAYHGAESSLTYEEWVAMLTKDVEEATANVEESTEE